MQPLGPSTEGCARATTVIEAATQMEEVVADKLRRNLRGGYPVKVMQSQLWKGVIASQVREPVCMLSKGGWNHGEDLSSARTS